MPVRDEITQAISLANDPKDRSMLLLMLAVLDRVEELLDDDKALQLKVLNGLTDHHADDHAWLREFREEQEKRRKDQRSIFKRLIEGAASQIGVIIVTALATIAGMQWLVK